MLGSSHICPLQVPHWACNSAALSICASGAAATSPGVAAIAAIAVVAAFGASAQNAPDYAAIIAAPDRREADRDIDKRRDPVKLLAFTGARPGMKVLDMGAGGGYSTELMHRLLNNTRYKSVAVWGDYIKGETRNEFLDTTEDEWANSTAIEWAKEEVENLTRLSQQADVIWNGFLEVFKPLEDNPQVAFGELLDYIEERRKKIESSANKDTNKAARSVPVGAPR